MVCKHKYYDVIEAHCYFVDIGRTDREQIHSRINNNDCHSRKPRNHNNWTKHPRYCAPLNIKGLSEKIAKVCVPLGVKPIFRPKKTLKRELMQVKNRTPEQKQTGVVYEIPCKDCPEVSWEKPRGH